MRRSSLVGRLKVCKGALASYKHELMEKNRMNDELLLRDVVSDDLPIFFAQQLDQEANTMAAFTAKDPTNQAAFMAHWHKILADDTCIIKTIIFDQQVAGSVSSYEEEGKPEVTYWLGKEYWGRGIATWALQTFLAHHNQARPMYARVAKDNRGPQRVLAKCGFTLIGEGKGFANARGQEIEELLLALGPFKQITIHEDTQRDTKKGFA